MTIQATVPFFPPKYKIMKFYDVEKIQNRRYQFNFKGYGNVIELLIENRADVNSVNKFNDTALIIALNGGNNS